MATATVWPKIIPPLTGEQQRISDDFMRYWHEVLPQRYGIVERFNHGYPVWTAPTDFKHTLEIGAGIGEHLQHEQLTPAQAAAYTAVELRDNMSKRLRERLPHINVVTGDCQQRLPFPAGYFDRILAIHVLEHLPNLPACVAELHRLCDKECGVLSVVIPCEGSLAYTLARRLSAQRIFEKRYGQSYRWFIVREHINYPSEIRAVLAAYFLETGSSYFPLRLPFEFCNLVIGLTLRPRKDVSQA
jgi:SAM-dependent methyltransferase